MSSKVSNVAILVRLIFAIIIMGLVIFLPAGTFLWIEAWIYLIFLFGFFGIVIIYFPKRDPELVKKRMDMKIKENWDKVFIIITGIAFTALFIIPGFDAVRFQWSFVPIVVKIVGFGGFLLSFNGNIPYALTLSLLSLIPFLIGFRVLKFGYDNREETTSKQIQNRNLEVEAVP